MEIDEREFRRLVRTVDENNKMLHKMGRRAFYGTIFQMLYYVIIIGAAVGSYFFLQPFIQAGKEGAQGIYDSFQNIRNVTDAFGG
ncbi:MAG: hypothetical protein Q8P93_00935 [bacterium]|nr:hypothetical protein [bacterium]